MYNLQMISLVVVEIELILLVLIIFPCLVPLLAHRVVPVDISDGLIDNIDVADPHHHISIVGSVSPDLQPTRPRHHILVQRHVAGSLQHWLLLRMVRCLPRVDRMPPFDKVYDSFEHEWLHFQRSHHKLIPFLLFGHVNGPHSE